MVNTPGQGGVEPVRTFFGQMEINFFRDFVRMSFMDGPYLNYTDYRISKVVMLGFSYFEQKREIIKVLSLSFDLKWC